MVYKKLSELDDDLLIWNGAIFRHFNVERLDAKNHEEDYYNMMLFDLGCTFYLINITQNSNKRGVIEATIEDIRTQYHITGREFKEYFKNNPDVYFIKEGFNEEYFSW